MRRFGRTRLRAISRRIRASGSPPAAGGSPNDIVSVFDDGMSGAVFETAADHALIVGQFIDIVGTEVYDGSLYEIASTPSATTFTVFGAVYVGTATGTWVLVEI